MAATSTIQYIAIMVIGILYQLITTTAVGITYEFYGSDSNFECSDADSDDICILHCDPNTPGSSQFNCGSARDCYFYCEDKQCLRAGILNATSSQNLYAYTSVELCYENANVYTAQRENYFNINEFDQREHKKIIINGGDSESIFINCTSTGSESCRQMIINAQNVTDLEIVGGAGTVMEDTIIYCPQNSDYNGPNEAPCFLDFSDGIIHKGNFYTLNGIPQDIMIYGELTSTVTIWCGAGFSVNTGSSFENTDCWITSAPTTYPTTYPTVNPSANPSVFPSSHPSPKPTANPFNPTLSPTKNPSAKPTANPSSSPTKTLTFYSLSHSSTGSTVKPSPKPTANPTSSPIYGNEGHVVVHSTETLSHSIETSFGDISDQNVIHIFNGIDIESIIISILLVIVCILAALSCIERKRQRKKIRPASAMKSNANATEDEEWWKSKTSILDVPQLDAAATSIQKVALQISHPHPSPQLNTNHFINMNVNILPPVNPVPSTAVSPLPKAYELIEFSTLSVPNDTRGDIPHHRKQNTNLEMEGVDDNDGNTTNKVALDIVLPNHLLTPDNNEPLHRDNYITDQQDVNVPEMDDDESASDYEGLYGCNRVQTLGGDNGDDDEKMSQIDTW